MRFAPATPRQKPREAIVPMINVVFLLLIFFLMTASIEARAPFEVSVPESASGSGEASAPNVLFLSADGTLAYGDAVGDAAFTSLVSRGPSPLDIRADRDVPATVLASVLARLAGIGIPEARLVTVRD